MPYTLLLHGDKKEPGDTNGRAQRSFYILSKVLFILWYSNKKEYLKVENIYMETQNKKHKFWNTFFLLLVCNLKSKRRELLKTGPKSTLHVHLMTTVQKQKWLSFALTIVVLMPKRKKNATARWQV